jgi:hypothetical protein
LSFAFFQEGKNHLPEMALKGGLNLGAPAPMGHQSMPSPPKICLIHLLPYGEFLAELDEIQRLKWIASENAGHDIGFEHLPSMTGRKITVPHGDACAIRPLKTIQPAEVEDLV